MSFRSPLRFLLALATALAAGSAAAAFDPVNDDTDIFLANPSFTASRPNVLIFVDNTANWSASTGAAAPLDSKYGAVKVALQAVLNGVVNDAFNVGLSLFVETGSPNNNTDGAYIRYGVRQMTTANKAQLVTMINGLDNNGDKSNGAVYSLAMAEMFNYYAGLSSRSSHGKDKTDAGGTIYFSTGRVALAGSPLASGALPANGGTAQTFVSPIVDACQKNFIIFISNGTASDNSSSLSVAQGLLAGITGTNPPATIPISPNGEQGVWADEYSKFMANSDCNLNVPGTQNVITYTLDLVPGTTGQGPSHTALLKSMATNGKGKYFAITDMSNTTQLENALKAIFSEVQAVNSVFASTTLPVSVNVRGTNLNQVYIGVFRPDPNKSPRWLGNLKLYKLGVDSATQNLFLADATGAAAENASTGFIGANAQSFWTTSTTFWSFRDPSLNGTGGSSDLVDGDLVEKGGAAQRLRLQFPASNAARNLYTCLDTTSTGPCTTTGLSSTPFNTTNVTAGALGAFSTKSVAGLNSAGTTATATVTAHGWANSNVVKVSGAVPVQYNGTFTITVVDANTFTYTMASAPDATRARVTAANHGLIPGDLTCIQSTTPAGYNICAVPITRIDANNFDYSPTVPQASAATFISPGSNYGGRQVPTVIGIPGGIPATTGLLPAAGFPNTIAKVVLPGHGYGAALATLNNTYLYLTLACTEWWCASSQVSTIQDANTLTIPVQSAIANTGINAAHVIAPNHGFSTGQSITVSGSLVSGYNGTQTVTNIDSNTFTFSSTQTSADTSAAIRAGAPITSIVHPTTGSAASKNTATVTTSTAHGFLNLQSIQIFGTGGAHNTTVNNCTYDTATGANNVSTWVVQSTPTTTTFTINGSNINRCVNTVTSGLAGYAITRIDPARIDAQAGIIHWKTLAPTAINPLTSATGTIIAGRPVDGNNAARDLIVNWVRSTDNKDDENLDGSGLFTDVRASVHGDVLHSRPATINYNRLKTLITGTDDDSVLQRDSDIYVFYGSNDGIFHAVKGGALQKPGVVAPLAVTVGPDANVTPGSERWGFIPQEFFSKLSRLRDQTPTVSNLNQKDYFFDGSIGVYLKDVAGSGSVTSPGTGTVTGVIGDNSGDKVYLYLSLRRGGNFIYALDVTNPTSPKLLWRKGNGDTGWGEVGQTWSEPKVARVKADIGNPSNPENVVLIFAAGHDDVVDDINPCLLSSFTSTGVVQKAIGSGSVTYTSVGACTITGATGGTTTFNRSKGRGILVVDAFNGNVVWQVGPAPAGAAKNLTVPSMTCAIPSDLSVLDKNRDGFADRLYVGDTCGNVWRADITSTVINDWAITRIASLSGTVTAVISDKRKFLFPPDLVFGTDTSNYTAVLMGSGDREHPFDTTVQNAFFMVKDRDDPNPANPSTGIPNSTTKTIATPTSSATSNPKTTSDLFDATNVIVDGTDPTSQNGWFINLLGGEKVVGSAVTIAGTTFFNTNQPSASAGGGACGSNLGVAREYLVGFADAAATVDLQGTGTLSIASRSTVHAGGGYLPSPVPVVVEINGKKYQAVISGTSVRQPPGTTLDARVRTFWYKDLD